MYRTILRHFKQYRTAAILTPVWTAAEVVMGVLIPYVTASIIDKGINAGSMPNVYKYGSYMVLMAFLSLLFGILPVLSRISSGFRVIILTLVIAGTAAWIRPVDPEVSD